MAFLFVSYHAQNSKNIMYALIPDNLRTRPQVKKKYDIIISSHCHLPTSKKVSADPVEISIGIPRQPFWQRHCTPSADVKGPVGRVRLTLTPQGNHLIIQAACLLLKKKSVYVILCLCQRQFQSQKKFPGKKLS